MNPLHRWDRLLEPLAEQPGATSESICQALTVEAMPYYRVPPRMQRAVTAFRHLGKADRLKVADEYLRRHPAPPSIEEQWKKKAEEHRRRAPLGHALILDSNSPGGSFYDADPADTFYLTAEGWVARHPFNYRIYLPLEFEASVLPRALVKLAVSRKTAFRITTDSLAKTKQTFGVVFMPPGDNRAAKLADKPEKAVELPGLSHGVALLFPSAPPEDIGVLAEYEFEKGKYHYGIMLRGTFYAIQIATDDFDPNPVIPV